MSYSAWNDVEVFSNLNVVDERMVNLRKVFFLYGFLENIESRSFLFLDIYSMRGSGEWGEVSRANCKDAACARKRKRRGRCAPRARALPLRRPRLPTSDQVAALLFSAPLLALRLSSGRSWPELWRSWTPILSTKYEVAHQRNLLLRPVAFRASSVLRA